MKSTKDVRALVMIFMHQNRIGAVCGYNYDLVRI
jgi:hypothetical protein